MHEVSDLERPLQDSLKEAHLVLGSEPSTQHRTSLYHHRRRNDESFFGAQQVTARSVVRLASSARFEQDARVDNQHGGSAATEGMAGRLSVTLREAAADRVMLTQQLVC